jgi:hypothetical protein
MTPDTFPIFVAIFSVWGLLVALKGATALRGSDGYTFSIWDGGMLRAGKRLNRMGTIIKVVVGAVMALGGLLSIAHAVSWRDGMYALIFVCVLSLASDFVCVERN